MDETLVSRTIAMNFFSSIIHTYVLTRIETSLLTSYLLSLDVPAHQSRIMILWSRLQLLRTVLIENKELVIGPAFTLVPQLFSLPYFIASQILQCRNLQQPVLRHLLTLSYFTTFIPPLISFRLYISPSTFYSQEWQATNVAK